MKRALTIFSAGDLDAHGIATGDDADRMVISAHHSCGQYWGWLAERMGTELSASPIQCQPCIWRSCLTPALSLSSGHLCNTLQGDCLEMEEQLKCMLTAYSHTA